MSELVKTENQLTTPPQRRTFVKGVEWIVADVSGSMGTLVEGTDKRRIDALNEAINSFGEHIQTVAFHDSCKLYIGPVALEPTGGTNLAKGLERVQQYEPNYIIVISDGRVNNEQTALSEAEKLSATCIIDTLYIGGSDPRAEEFMARLATVGNGRFRKYDTTKLQTLSLTNVIQGLLPPPEEIIQS